MFDETANQQQVQSFLLRMTRDDANTNWQLLLKPIDGDEHFLFTDVAAFIDTLITMTEPHSPARQPGNQTERRDQ